MREPEQVDRVGEFRLLAFHWDKYNNNIKLCTTDKKHTKTNTIIEETKETIPRMHRPKSLQFL